jgi:epoxyqueuosine reductase
MLTSSEIKDHARRLGFDVCGIAPADTFPELGRLREWLDRGYGGDMRYLERSAATRADIRHFLPAARAVVVTATVYYVDEPPSDDAIQVPAAIARYARGADYHDVLASRLDELVTWMRERSPVAFESRIFVDKHHVQERAYAKHAGVGWIGKNTCLINADLGSWLFLAGVAVSLDLEADAPVADLCGACTLCLDACPTGALVDEYQLDATRCISYLTIENKGSIPEERRAQIGSHVFGCDICQEVCPHNLAPLATLDPAWQPQQNRARADAAALWQQSDHDLHDLMAGSAMTRVTVSRLRRNLAVVLGNSAAGDADALDRPAGRVPRAAQSAVTPLVVDHVDWAKKTLRDRRRTM